MNVIKEENNNDANNDTSVYSTAPSMNSVSLTSMPSIIHANQPSVIQTASPTKGNVILVGGKLSSVIQPPPCGTLHSLQVVNSSKCDSMVEKGSVSEEDSLKRRREKLFRRPSYRKILNDIERVELDCTKMESSGSDCDSNMDGEISNAPYSTAVPSGHLPLTSQCGGNAPGLPATIMSNSISGSASLIQYSSQEGPAYYVPNDMVVTPNSSNVSISGVITEDQVRKREMRLLKNREAARECRRKKKEYIKCLENRVAVLENQNKALIDELKSLKELYCQHKE